MYVESVKSVESARVYQCSQYIALRSVGLPTPND